MVALKTQQNLDTIKNWLLQSLFKASPAVKDLQADVLINIVNQLPQDTPSKNVTTLYEAFKNSQCIELKNLIKSYSSWNGDNSTLDQNIKAIAKAIEEGTNQS